MISGTSIFGHSTWDTFGLIFKENWACATDFRWSCRLFQHSWKIIGAQKLKCPKSIASLADFDLDLSFPICLKNKANQAVLPYLTEYWAAHSINGCQAPESLRQKVLYCRSATCFVWYCEAHIQCCGCFFKKMEPIAFIRSKDLDERSRDKRLLMVCLNY